MAYADELDELVEKIIDSAIKFYMESHGWFIWMHGDYRMRTPEPGAEDLRITPPGSPERTSGGQVRRAVGFGVYNGFEYGGGENAGSLVYGHFEKTIRELFRPWKDVPEPESFDGYLDVFRDGAWHVALPGDGDTVSGVGNAELDVVKFLQERITATDMGGRMILTFNQNFCTPLPTVIHGQYAVVLLACATLCGERQIWAKAREDVLNIARKVLQAMDDRGSSVHEDLDTITALFSIAAVLPTPASPILAGVASVIPALETLINGGDEPSKPTVEFAGSSADKVIESGREALKKLSQTIRDCEDDIERRITDAMELVTSRSGSFDMPKPHLLEESDIGGMKANLEVLNVLATETLPKIGRQVYLAADEVATGAGCTREWYRSPGTETSDAGVRSAWSALVTLAGDLLGDLGWEIKESAAHLEIASHRIGQTEAEVVAAMKRHSASLAGSGHDPVGTATAWLNNHR